MKQLCIANKFGQWCALGRRLVWPKCYGRIARTGCGIAFVPHGVKMREPTCIQCRARQRQCDCVVEVRAPPLEGQTKLHHVKRRCRNRAATRTRKKVWACWRHRGSKEQP